MHFKFRTFTRTQRYVSNKFVEKNWFLLRSENNQIFKKHISKMKEFKTIIYSFGHLISSLIKQINGFFNEKLSLIMSIGGIYEINDISWFIINSE